MEKKESKQRKVGTDVKDNYPSKKKVNRKWKEEKGEKKTQNEENRISEKKITPKEKEKKNTHQKNFKKFPLIEKQTS